MCPHLTPLHPRKALSRDFRPPQALALVAVSRYPAPASSSHRHTKIRFRLSDGNWGWSWGGGEGWWLGVHRGSVRVGSLQGCLLIQATGVGSPRRRHFPPPSRLFSYACANISSFSAATRSRRRLHSLEGEVPSPPALKPAPRLPGCCASPWPRSSAAHPLNFRGG